MPAALRRHQRLRRHAACYVMTTLLARRAAALNFAQYTAARGYRLNVVTTLLRALS